MILPFSDLSAFRRDALGFLEAKGAEVGPLVRLRIGPRPAYLVNDTAVVRQALKADEGAIDKGRLVYKLRQIVGSSSLIISGQAHRDRRAVIHRTLAEGVAGEYVPQIAEVVRHWTSAVLAGGAIDAHQATAHLALRIICAILFGPGALSDGDQAAIIEAVHLIEDDLAVGMFQIMPDAPWVYRRKQRKLRQARQMMAFVVDRVRAKAGASSLFAAFEKIGLGGDDLQDEVLMLLLAGHHTSGSAAAWILYHLALDPNLAARIAAEAAAVSDQGDRPTPIAIRRASLSRAFASEILRLYPSTYWTSRELKVDQVIAGKRLRRGTSLILSPWHLHRDPRHWAEPGEFRLDRNWTANPAYLPFGFGGRACVGLNVAMLELQMLALEVARSADVEIMSAVPAARPRPSITLVPPPIALRFRSCGHTSPSLGAAA